MWFVAAEERLPAARLADGDAGRVRSHVRSTAQHVWVFYLTRLNLKDSVPNKYAC